MKFKKVKVLALSATLVLALTACSKQGQYELKSFISRKS